MNSVSSARGTSVPGSISGTHQIVGIFPELLGVGGVQEACRLTAAALQEIALAHKVSTEFLSLNDAEGPHNICVAGVVVRFRGYGRAKARLVLAGMRKAVPSLRHRSSILLVAHPHLALPAALIRMCSPRLRTVVMAHGVEVWTPLAAHRRLALQRATRLLAPSRDTAQKLVAVQCVEPEKVRRLPWPLSPDFSRIAAAPRPLALVPSYPEGRVILTVGRWSASERYKGLDELLHAVARLRPTVPGLHLVAVGAGDDLPRLKRISLDLGIEGVVHFRENLSREQLAACYAHAEIFALPSTREGFGLVFLEAMAFAKPIVAAASGGTTDVVEDGINGLLVPPNDVKQLASVLGRLLADGSLRRRLGQGGAETVRQKYQFISFRNELDQILAECGLP